MSADNYESALGACNSYVFMSRCLHMVDAIDRHSAVTEYLHNNQTGRNWNIHAINHSELSKLYKYIYINSVFTNGCIDCSFPISELGPRRIREGCFRYAITGTPRHESEECVYTKHTHICANNCAANDENIKCTWGFRKNMRRNRSERNDPSSNQLVNLSFRRIRFVYIYSSRSYT